MHRDERGGRAASPAPSTITQLTCSVGVKKNLTCRDILFRYSAYIFWINQLKHCEGLSKCMLCWGPLDNGQQRLSGQIIHDPSHVIIDSEFRQPRSHSGLELNNEALYSDCNGYLPDEDDTIKSRIVRYHFS